MIYAKKNRAGGFGVSTLDSARAGDKNESYQQTQERVEKGARADDKIERRNNGARICPMRFEATVRQGPNAEQFSLEGSLQLKYTGDESEVDGKLTLDSGGKIPVQGQIFSRAAGLTLEVAESATLVGVGNMFPAHGAQCTSFTGGGIFSGPDAADAGSWAVSNCVPDINSFFGQCVPVTCNPTIAGASFNNKGRFTFNAGGSCEQSGATLTVQKTDGSGTAGTFPLAFGETGTRRVGR